MVEGEREQAYICRCHKTYCACIKLSNITANSVENCVSGNYRFGCLYLTAMWTINTLRFNRVPVCVTEVGCSWGGTRLVTCDLCTSIY